MSVGKFLLPIAVITSVTIGLAAYRFIDHAYGTNVGFLVGFITLMVSTYFINTNH